MQVRGNYLSLFPLANSVKLPLCELPLCADQLQFSTLFHKFSTLLFSSLLRRGETHRISSKRVPTIDPPVLNTSLREFIEHISDDHYKGCLSRVRLFEGVLLPRGFTDCQRTVECLELKVWVELDLGILSTYT